MICNKISSYKDIKVNMNYRLFPDVKDREFWEGAKKNSGEFFEYIYKLCGNPPRKFLTASLYREFEITGNRSNYEGIYFARRNELIVKVFMECFSNDGSFMDDIFDLTWMILEETAWVIPAHEAGALPDFKRQTLDLFAAETACTMAFVYQTVGSKLDEYSPVVTRRIVDRIEHMILDDYLERDDYWWMGFTDDLSCNWCVWINSNIIACAIAVCTDKERLQQILYKACRSVDIYINKHPDDGACDEGPSYWNQAGLCLMECLWMLKLVTDNQLDFFDNEMVKNTLEYFMKVYTGNGECVNFADCHVKVAIYYATIYKFAQISGNDDVKSFAHQLYKDAPMMNITTMESGSISKVFRMLDVAKYMGEISSLKYDDCVSKTDYYLESTNVLTSKSHINPGKGLIISAKGGHNDESHNHNDVGHFVVYKNGIKFIVDPGCMQYTAFTFSDKRYTIWPMRSKYHNVPVIGGSEQMNGRDFYAANVVYESHEDGMTFALDIKEAYPNKADIDKWRRTISFDRTNQEIQITEDFSFAQEMEYELGFITPAEPKQTEDGVLLTGEKGETLSITFAGAKLDYRLEEIDLADQGLVKQWGSLYRIGFKAKAYKDVITYTIK